MPLDSFPFLAEKQIEQLLASVADAGRRLLSSQPSRALQDEPAMRRCFELACAGTMQHLSACLGTFSPDIPVFQAGLTPDQLPETAGPYWICDPVDGAIQYLAGLPMWTTTLTLMVGQVPCLAIVHDACMGRTYHAVRGGGAACNGAAIRCNTEPVLALSTVGTSFPNLPPRPRAEMHDFLLMLGQVIPAVLAQRWIGSATLSLALVASGKLDAYWECGRHLVDWLPGVLIAREAGALVSPLAGNVLGQAGSGLIAAPASVHGHLLDMSRVLRQR